MSEQPNNSGQTPPSGVVPSANLPPVKLSPPPTVPPLGESEFAAIRHATDRYQPLRRAARVAKSSSIITLFIGITAIPLVLFWPSWDSALVTLGLCIIGVVEYKGSGRIRRAETNAGAFLAKNQLALLGVITLYCVVQMLTFSTGAIKDAAISPEFRSELGGMTSVDKTIDSQIDRYAPMFYYGFYGLVIFVSILSQGGMALYYFTRRRHIEAFNAQTPQWVRQLLTETKQFGGAGS
ncbi:MAG: hypothetical protein EHM48_06605 [Planctomycetaceae bacterium]|nr:MAG: hypothetical protein EHM48_06605 [Planctomycetaceae bacterium]